MQRYSIIRDKNPREIVLLRGKGCQYKRCAFCDYHEDASQDEKENLRINRIALSQVTGKYGSLEIINSGSFCELDENTMSLIIDTCRNRYIRTVHFECHWLYRNHIPRLRERFSAEGIKAIIKTGIETFDYEYREKVMLKGIKEKSAERLSKDFDECCLLFGLPGQDTKSMTEDIETGLKWFNRVCVNIMTSNTARLQPDKDVIRTFLQEVYPIYRNNIRVDILLHNTDFGVGNKDNEL